MQSIGSLEAAEKPISAKIFKENLHTVLLETPIMVVCPRLYPWYQFLHSNVAIQSLSACRYNQSYIEKVCFCVQLVQLC